MARLEDAIERIKRLECPTGEVENRVAGILEDYGVTNRNEVSFSRDVNFDGDGGESYCAKLKGADGKSLVVLAKSGMDDYVAKVVDAYLQ